MIRALKPSNTLRIVFLEAVYDGNTSYLQWMLSYQIFHVQSVEYLIHGYLQGKISRADLMQLLHAAASEDSFLSETSRTNLITLIVHRRDAELFQYLLRQNLVTVQNLMCMDIPALQWALHMGLDTRQNLITTGFNGVHSERNWIWLIQNGFKISDRSFVWYLDSFSAKLLKHLLKSGYRIPNPKHIIYDSPIWKDPRLLKKILRFHDWQCHKQILLKKCKDPAVERIVNDL